MGAARHCGRLGRRIAVVGSTGSGKTTLARELAIRLGAPHVELDALHWGPGWTLPPPDLFRERVSAALGGDAWTADGNYSSVRDIVWGRADTLVWLDYPLPIIVTRLTRRTITRVVGRVDLWNGNRETIRNTFLARDSLLLWALKTHRRRRKVYASVLAGLDYRHLRVIHLISPRQTRRWLAGVRATPVLTD